MQSASRSRGRRRRGGARRAPCVPLQALTALPLSEQNDPGTTPTRCDATRRDADFGKCNCNLLKFVAVAASRDTNRRRSRRRRNKTRKTNAAPKKTNRSHPGKKFRSHFLPRFCVAPQHPSACTLHRRPAHFAGHQKLQWRSKVDTAIVFKGYPTHTARTLWVAPHHFLSSFLYFCCIVCELLFLVEMIMTGMEQISIYFRGLISIEFFMTVSYERLQWNQLDLKVLK